ncbi:MAG: ribosome assembly factor SBDS [Candidatus Woesearchaeota archaeon]
MTEEHINTARLKKGSDVFEIVVEPETAIAARHGKADIKDALRVQKIFSDAKKGMLASEQRMQAVFGTSDPLEVAKKIIAEGNIQVTAEYRQKLLEQKKRQVVEFIRRNGVDPRTHAPHPAQRIESAMAEAKVRIDEFKPAEQQVQDVLKALRPILPIKFETKEIELTIPAQYASKSHNTLRMFGKIVKEEWQNDGSWKGIIEVPGGMEQELYDKLNALTHGELVSKVIRVNG